MGFRFTVETSIGERVIRCLRDPALKARWLAADFSYASLQIKMYIVSWRTFTDVTAQLISEVFDLGLPPKEVELNAVLANRHVANTGIPKLFAQHRAALRAEEFSRLRNEVVHRSYLDEPELRAVEQKLNYIILKDLMSDVPKSSGLDAILNELREFVEKKNRELDEHFSSMLEFLDKLLLALAGVMETRNGT